MCVQDPSSPKPCFRDPSSKDKPVLIGFQHRKHDTERSSEQLNQNGRGGGRRVC